MIRRCLGLSNGVTVLRAFYCLEAARKNGVRRVVYTSSVATMGFTSNGHPADEDSPVSLADMIGHYKRSKFMAEQVALEAGRSGMQVVTVNPTTPVGEQDVKPTPTGRIVLDFLKRKFPAYVETGLNLVDVRECARGHIAALEKGKEITFKIEALIEPNNYTKITRTKEVKLKGGENAKVDLTVKDSKTDKIVVRWVPTPDDIVDTLGRITGLPSPKVKLPYIFAFAAGVVDEAITGRMLHREPRATVDTVRMGKKKMFASSGKAERELGWKILPVEGALRRAVDWFRSNGYV